MNWLINILYSKCKDYIDAYFATHPPACCFHHRPCPPTPDWNTPDLAASTAWITREASPFVPTGTRAILLRCFGQSSASDQRLQIRAIGDTPWHNMGVLRTQVANRYIEMDKIVTLNDALQFETKVSAVTWIAVYMTIQGYWKTGIIQNSFFNRGDPSVPDFTTDNFIKDTTWRSLDLSGIIPAGTKAVLLVCDFRSTIGARRVRFRTHGNSNIYNISHCRNPMADLNYAYDITVPTDGHRQIEYNVTAATYPELSLTVKGWWF